MERHFVGDSTHIIKKLIKSSLCKQNILFKNLFYFRELVILKKCFNLCQTPVFPSKMGRTVRTRLSIGTKPRYDYSVKWKLLFVSICNVIINQA